MREIKFRGKREDNGDWVFGSFIPDALEGSNSDLVSWGFIRRYNRGIGKMETIEVDRETVGQFTGLHDMNGAKIFEGDICRDSLGWVFKVMWDSDNARFLGQQEKLRGDTYICYVGRIPAVEVIGNIHDGGDS